MNDEVKDSQPRTISPDCGMRQSAKNQLLQAARALRNKAHALEQLADQVEHVRGEAEMALWQLVVEARL